MTPSDQLPFVDGPAAPPAAGSAPVVDPGVSEAGMAPTGLPPHAADPDADTDVDVDVDVDGPAVDEPAPSPAPDRPRASFQASAGIQGRQFAEQCDTLLGSLGYELRGRRLLPEVGVEIDQEAVAPDGSVVWFEYKGSIQGNRPGLRRTDTVKKAVANGALLAAVADAAPYVVITSHMPDKGAAAAMIDAAQQLGYLSDVVCLYDPAATVRLRRW